MSHDALAAHTRDDIGITEVLAARPLQAAAASSLSFALGGMFRCSPVYWLPRECAPSAIAAVSLVFLAALGALAARAGGAPLLRGAVRVLIWGALVMGVTGAAGALVGVIV